DRARPSNLDIAAEHGHRGRFVERAGQVAEGGVDGRQRLTDRGLLACGRRAVPQRPVAQPEDDQPPDDRRPEHTALQMSNRATAGPTYSNATRAMVMLNRR